MASLSEEYALASKTMYGQDYIDELAEFLKENNVKTILECGCGDGYILHGLAEKDFRGMGIDSNSKIIELALKNHKHPNVEYKEMNWLHINRLNKKFDLVMCRGNSLSYVVNWENEKNFDPDVARFYLTDSVGKFFGNIRKNGLLYIDTISQSEIDEGDGIIHFKGKDVDLKGKKEYDWNKRIRYLYGGGKVKGETFQGNYISYLIKPDELEQIIKGFNPSKIWSPKFVHERNYHIICAKK